MAFMDIKNINEIQYIIFDPSKNITALVNSEVNEKDLKEVALKIMQKETAVEQVGFLSHEEGVDIVLHMAGDEFCGNATMSAAVYHCIKESLSNAIVKVKVYGENDILFVNVNKTENGEWEGTVKMPKAIEIKKVLFENGEEHFVVFFQGIAHIVIDANNCESKFNTNDKEDVRQLCDFLGVKALGIMYYDDKEKSLRPIVYVKSIDSLFVENSCASGTTAIGLWLSHKNKENINTKIKQVGGDFLTVSTNDEKEIFIKGIVRTNYSPNSLSI